MKMKTTAVFGPPGTGKTAEIMRAISRERERLDDMAVVSFSRAAAKELSSRLVGEAPAFVGTIHSFCYGELGLDRQQVVASLAPFRTAAALDHLGPEVDQAIEIVQLARRRGRTIRSQYLEWTNLTTSIDFCERIGRMYESWKKHFGVLDFDDMLSQAAGHTHKFSLVFVDEAQDLSRLQWDVVLNMVKPGGQLVVAGDDDQAIFTWAGADPHKMRRIADEVVVLSQSHRIPRAVHRAANSLISAVTNRQSKEYLPMDREGYFTYLGDLSGLLSAARPKTVMCRDRYTVRSVEEEAVRAGVPYVVEGQGDLGLFAGRKARVKAAIMERDGETLKRFRRWLTPYGQDILDGGGIPDWRWAMDLEDHEVWYLETVNPEAEPVLTVSTIHKQKGKEFDHAVIVAHCSSRVESLQETTAETEDEVRVWYVAMTRAKEGVTIVGTNPFLL